MASDFAHRPALLSEALAHLDPQPDAVIVDATLGGGGHAEAILERTAPSGILVAIDRDPDALAAAGARLAPFAERVRLVHGSFSEFGSLLADAGFERVDGVLFDLGVSSHQLDTPERGFRFGEATAEATPLDMRMDPSVGPTAADLLAELPGSELERCFREYGELPGARRLARAIVDTRRHSPPRTAADLLAIIHASRIGRGRKHHPATLVFQALRIAVNDEIAALETGLEAAIESLRPGRRIVVIAYHSLEDRLVKNCFRNEVRGCICPPRIPVCVCGRQPRLRLLTKRPLNASDEEVRENPRARSARLRAAVRLDVEAAA